MMAGLEVGLSGWIWMGVWIAALLFMVWLLVGRGRDRDDVEEALDILRRRLARGEISQEEFERTRALLALPSLDHVAGVGVDAFREFGVPGVFLYTLPSGQEKVFDRSGEEPVNDDRNREDLPPQRPGAVPHDTYPSEPDIRY